MSPARAEADDARLGAIDVESAREADAAADKPPLESASVSVVQVRELPAGTQSVADLVARTAGVHARRTGGVGAPVALSIRGSGASEVAVYLDGVPLQRASLGMADLALLPVGALDRIEVYRGGAPGSLGGQGLGGVINLVTRRPRGAASTEARVAGGSLASRELELHHGARPGDYEYGVYFRYFGTSGEFPYFDDHGTPFNPADDASALRRNNAIDALDLQLRAGYDRGPTRATLAERVAVRSQGVPTLGSLTTSRAHLDTTQSITDLRAERRGLAGGLLDLELRGDATVEDQTYRNPDAVQGADSTFRTVAGGGSARAQLSLGTLLLHLQPSGRVEDLGEDNRLAPARATSARRVGAATAAGLEASWLGDDLVLEADGRLDWQDTSGQTGNLFTPTRGRVARGDLEPTFRAGVRARLPAEVTLRASVARRFRPPTFYELFGDRGTFVGNETLAPETGLHADASVGCTWKEGKHLARLEATYFEARVDDVIVVVPSGRAARAANVAGATSRGVEATAQAAWGGLTLDGSYTYLHAVDRRSGKRLPGRPEHDAAARVRGESPASWLGGVVVAARWQLEIAAGVYRDLANQLPLPTRAFHDVALEVRPVRWLEVALEVRNLLDQRTETLELPVPGGQGTTRVQAAVADFGGYPLPGRTLWASTTARF